MGGQPWVVGLTELLNGFFELFSSVEMSLAHAVQFKTIYCCIFVETSDELNKKPKITIKGDDITAWDKRLTTLIPTYFSSPYVSPGFSNGNPPPYPDIQPANASNI